MRKSIKIEGEICGNCAAKIQRRIENLEGVNSASINFLTLRFTLDAQDEKFDEILSEAKKIFNDVEPSCSIRP